MIKRVKVAKLRFRADDGSEFPEWEEKRVSDVFTKVRTKNIEQKITNVITNSAEYGLIHQKDFFDKNIAVDGNTDNYTIILTGDFVYNPRKSKQAPYGPFNCYELPEVGIVSPLYTCLRPIGNENTKYLYWYFQTNKWHRFIYENGAQNGARHDRVGMTDELMKDIPVSVPSLPEQQKIASFLSTIDEIIQSTESELTAWQERKKGVMQKIFNREVRFKADDGSEFPEWEEKRLGEVGQFYTGVGFSDRFQGYKELPIDVYKVSDMNINGNEKYMKTANNTVDDNILRDMKTKSVNDSCLVFAKVGAAIYGERKRITLKPFVIDNNMMAFMPDVQLLQMEYLYTWFCSVRFSKYAQVGALPSYNSSDIGCIKIPIPSLPEQKKIAECLSSLDDVINQIKAELSAWKEFKKGLLQQMFV